MRWPWRRRRDKARHAAPPPRRTASWAQAAVPPAEERVRLGFADGSEVELRADDPTALALQAVADVLVGKDSA
jgi:hypothetical protein